MNAIALAALGTGFTFLMTAAGAAVVLVMRRQTPPLAEKLFLGFAAGVMTASSVWSLLLPAIEMTGGAAWLPASCGVAAGALLLAVADVRAARLPGGAHHMALAAMTLHNVPEGMAVGLACALSAADGALIPSAAALALGVGLQNFPEGAAAALPLRRGGMGRLRSFALGAASGLAEPVGGVLAVCAAGAVRGALPWLLSFAAGAMLYVVTKELIPEAVSGSRRAAYLGTAAVLFGFVLMMALDVALG